MTTGRPGPSWDPPGRGRAGCARSCVSGAWGRPLPLRPPRQSSVSAGHGPSAGSTCRLVREEWDLARAPTWPAASRPASRGATRATLCDTCCSWWDSAAGWRWAGRYWHPHSAATESSAPRETGARRTDPHCCNQTRTFGSHPLRTPRRSRVHDHAARILDPRSSDQRCASWDCVARSARWRDGPRRGSGRGEGASGSRVGYRCRWVAGALGAEEGTTRAVWGPGSYDRPHLEMKTNPS